MKQRSLALFAAAVCAGAALSGLLPGSTVPAHAQAQAQPPAADMSQMRRAMEMMQKHMAIMTPDLVEQANALSPQTKQFLMSVLLKHPRQSDTLTLRQVMQEILADHQAIGAAIMVENHALAADAARRILDHRLPRGGMLPYLPRDKVTTTALSVLPSMEEAVEGGARLLAAAADRGDMVAAAQHYGTMTSGCVACHAHFRGQPGVSSRLRTP